jgi:hypothetical protein
VGAFFGGQLSDLYVRYDARRRGGKFLPESRLMCLGFATVICPVGILLFGIGAQHHWHWAILYAAYGFVSVMPNIAIIAMTYSVDSYFEVASEILLLMNGLKAIGAFGFFYGFIPWTASVGYSAVSPTMKTLLVMAYFLPGVLYNGRHLVVCSASRRSYVLLWTTDQKLHHRPLQDRADLTEVLWLTKSVVCSLTRRIHSGVNRIS